MKKQLSFALAAALGLTICSAVPAAASTNVSAEISGVVATKKGRNYTTSAVVKIHAPKKSSTLKVSTTFNPTGSTKSTGKTQKRTVKAKWNKKGYYTATVKFTAKNVGKLSVSAKTSGKTAKKSHSFKLIPQVASARSVQTGKNKIASTFTLRVVAPRTTSTLKVSTTFNPTGSTKSTGKTQKRTVKAKWNKKGYYTATVKFTAKNVGSFNFTAKPMGKTVKLPKAAKTSGARSSLKISGARSATVNGSTKRTVTVSPAYGRTIYVQERVGTTWKNIASKKATNKKTYKYTVTLPAPAYGASREFRVAVGKGTGVAAVSSTPVTLTRPAKPVVTPPATQPPVTPPSSGGSNGDNGSGNDSGDDDGSGGTDGPVLSGPSGADCNAFDGWGDPLPCDTLAYGHVLDRLIAGDDMGCGVTLSCALPYSFNGIENVGTTRWRALNASEGTPSTLLAPDWLKALNDIREGEGVPAVKPLPVQTTQYGYTSEGQGGIAQEYANELMRKVLAENRALKASDHIEVSRLQGEWSKSTSASVVCAENLQEGENTGWSKQVINAWVRSPSHFATMIHQDFTHAAIGIAQTQSGRTIAVLHLCTVPE